jgi:hypothetical protein
MKGRCIDNSKGCQRLLEIGKLYDLAPAKYTPSIGNKFNVLAKSPFKNAFAHYDLYKWRFKILPGELNNNIIIL